MVDVAKALEAKFGEARKAALIWKPQNTVAVNDDTAYLRLSGGCQVDRGAYIGTGVCVREGLTIGELAFVGMGAVVTRDVPPERLWLGSPARDFSRAPLPGVVGRAA